MLFPSHYSNANNRLPRYNIKELAIDRANFVLCGYDFFKWIK